MYGFMFTSRPGGAAAGAGSIGLVSTGSFYADNGPAATFALPSGLVTGNLLVLIAVQPGGGDDVTLPSGWTVENGTQSTDYLVVYRYVDGSEVDPTITFTGFNNSAVIYGAVFQFQGTVSSDPFGTTGTNATTGSTISNAGITTEADGSLVLAIAFVNLNVAIGAVSPWTLEGMNFSGTWSAASYTDVQATAGASASYSRSFGSSHPGRVSLYEIKAAPSAP